MAEITKNQVPGSIGGPLAGLFMAALLVAAPAAPAPDQKYTPGARFRASSPTLNTSGKSSAAFATSIWLWGMPSSASTASPVHASAEIDDIIKAERARARIDDENVAIADAAMADALSMLRHVYLRGSPQVTFSDDGILGLQWQTDNHGVAIIFAGDGIASIAFKRPGQFYAENGLEVAVSEDFPDEFNKALEKILD
jgi:hypothetical protein